MGDHSYRAQDYPPGTVFGPNGEPAGPRSDTSVQDAFGAAGQEPAYEEVEDLQPDLSQWDPAVVRAS